MNILITGAAQGIGAAMATKLATSANSLILVDLQKDKLESFASSLKPNCTFVQTFAGDLTEAKFLSDLCTYLGSNPVDVLINNAAIAHKLTPLGELTSEQLDLALKINVKVPFELIKAVLLGMKAGCQILNIASRANVYGYPGMGIYAATKAAITSFSGTIALDYPGIKAVTIIPGRTNTPMQANIRGAEEASKAQSPDYLAEIVSQVVNGEIATKSGDSVLIDFGEYKVMSNLDRETLHRNTH